MPQFKGLYKPKHHFAAHAVVNIGRRGPMSEYHCYSYEGFHQRVKHMCEASNYKNVSKRVGRFWGVQFGITHGTKDPAVRTALSNLA